MVEFIETSAPKAEIIEDQSVKVYFNASLKNTATVASGNEIWPVVAPSSNFNMSLVITNADISNGGTDTLNLASSYTMFTDPLQAVAGLAPSSGLYALNTSL